MTEGRSEGNPLGGDSDSYVAPWDDALKARRDFSKGSKTGPQSSRRVRRCGNPRLRKMKKGPI